MAEDHDAARGHPPGATVELARAVAADGWGLDGELGPLAGEVDRNFLVTDSGGERFVLKIAPVGFDVAAIECQLALLEHLAGSPVAALVPRPVPTVSGERIRTVADGGGGARSARLLTWLDGTPLAALDRRPRDLLAEIGRTLARLDLALADFDHPGARREHPWDLRRAPELLGLAGHIADDVRRAEVEAHLRRFDEEVSPWLGSLEQGTIYNDANDHNLLVDAAADPPRLAGIVDFGDAQHTITIAELAIALAYLMLDRDDPLGDAAAATRGYHSVRPLTPLERGLLPLLVTGRLCASVLMAARGRAREPDNRYLQISEAAVWRLLAAAPGLETGLADAIASACRAPAPPVRSKDEILAVRRRHLGRNLSVSYSEPLKIVRGRGQYLFDDAGRRYLDLVNNVCHVGHCHPHVVAAGRRQMAQLNTNTRYLHDHLAEYALRLTATFPDPLSVCFLVCTGTEANDLALRLARSHTGRRGIVVLEHAYHGHSPSLIEISTYKCEGPGGEGLAPHAHKVPMPDPYRGPHRGADAGRRYADEVRAVVDRLAAAGRPPGAFIAESLIGCGGQVVPAPGFLPGASDAVRAAGGVTIADEVQVGFGRVGSHVWAFEHLEVVPDIVTLGKPIGNGHPMAAVVTTPEVADSFDTGMEYFNTFGGNPVSCAIGLAVLEVIEGEGLQERALLRGEQLLAGLGELQRRHRLIGDVRGVGLFLGVELVRDRNSLEPAEAEAAAVVDAMRRRGVLLSTDGPWHNVLKIKPPMVLTRDDVDAALEALDEVLGEVEDR